MGEGSRVEGSSNTSVSLKKLCRGKETCDIGEGSHAEMRSSIVPRKKEINTWKETVEGWRRRERVQETG